MSFCNNMLLNYQNLCPKCTRWLRHDAGVSFRGGLERSTDPQGFTILVFFPVNCIFETVLLLQKR